MFLARTLRAWEVFLLSSEGVFPFLVGRRACRTRGKRVRPSCRERVRCARASPGRCFLSSGEGTFVGPLRGR